MPTIVGIAAGDPNFSILVATLQHIDTELGTDYVTVLDSPGALTVFAPTNAAFATLAGDLGYGGDPADVAAVTAFLTANVDAATLEAVVTYHVSPGIQLAADLADGGTIATLNGETITRDGPTLVDMEPDLIDPSLVATDIAADNGVVHVIDRVLLPVDLPGNDAPTITEIVADSGSGFDNNAGDFDILLAAVTTAGLAGVLNDPDLDLTVFAPTDGAFVGLSTALGYDGTDEAGAWTYLVESLTLLGGGDPIPLLTQVLTYHVSGESLQSSQVLSALTIPTLQGGDLGVSGTMLVDAEPDVADPSIVGVDIQAANGIIHVIDGVLLPADLLQSDGSGDVDFVIGGDDGERIRTGRDNDYADGNGGDDSIKLGAGDDVGLGGSGDDSMKGGKGDDLMLGEDGNDGMKGGSGDDTLDGGAGDDEIKGGSGNDMLSGGSGDDGIKGGSGDDMLYGGDGMDNLKGGAGNDMLDGGADMDTLKGGGGDDMLMGGGGDDSLMGGGGDDTLEGGTGNDILVGGGGSDTFIFNIGDGEDEILRFRSGSDLIDLSDYGFVDFAALKGSISQVGKWTEIDLGGGDILNISGRFSELTVDDFIL